MESFVYATESAGVSLSQRSHLKGIFCNYLILLEEKEGERKGGQERRKKEKKEGRKVGWLFGYFPGL